MIQKRVSWVSIILVILLLAATTNALAAQGAGSFLYHRYGASISPTWKFWYVDGSTSNVTSPDPDDVPTLSRRFAPSQSATTLTQFKSTNNYWVVDAKWSWNYGIGTAFSQFTQNKPISGQNFFLTEAHVSRGWLWKAYYTNMPGTIRTHLFNNAIYKPTYVECDIWTQSPNQFSGWTQYHTQWMFEPETGKDFNSLPKTFGHAHVITIYRWWNAIHVASGHGDPMDKIAWRDDLGTFGPNVSGAGTLSSEVVAREDSFTLAKRGPEMVIGRNVSSGADLQSYLAARSAILTDLDPQLQILATVTVRELDVSSAVTLAADHGCTVEYVGFRTMDGSGASRVTDGDLEGAISDIETAFDITVEKIEFLVVRGRAGELASLEALTDVHSVDPAVYVNQGGQLSETLPPDPVNGELREFGNP